MSLLTEIGSGLNISVVGQMAEKDLPLEVRLRSIAGFISSHGDMERTRAAVSAEAVEKYRKNMEEVGRIWSPQLTEQWERVQAAQRKAREARQKVSGLERDG